MTMMQRQSSGGSFNDSAGSLLGHHRCLRGFLHLTHGMRLLITVGLVAIIGLLVLEAIYFRRGIFVLIIPFAVCMCTIWATFSLDRAWVRPIIGISYFHMFLASYLLLIFSYFFIFKPLYIIMVLNWAFDTLYTKKTVSYYVQCFCIFMGLIAFALFNLWQLSVAENYAEFLDVVQRTDRSSSNSTRTAMTEIKTEPVVLVVNRNPSDMSARDYRMAL
uniref:Uncharacterized protein n=1 Tax=Panagrellus redivivus TaxID=6233 RepID=A0A7E4VXV9_PANRE